VPTRSNPCARGEPTYPVGSYCSTSVLRTGLARRMSFRPVLTLEFGASCMRFLKQICGNSMTVSRVTIDVGSRCLGPVEVHSEAGFTVRTLTNVTAASCPTSGTNGSLSRVPKNIASLRTTSPCSEPLQPSRILTGRETRKSVHCPAGRIRVEVKDVHKFISMFAPKDRKPRQKIDIQTREHSF
jgi:hypothetical protein